MFESKLVNAPGRRSVGVRLKKDWRDNWKLYLLLLPALAFFIVFCYVPMAGLTMAFQDYEIALGLFRSPWVGFMHFSDFFQSMEFWMLIRNTLLFSLLNLVFVFPTPIILALMIHSVKKPAYRRVILTAVYLPYFISLVVVCGLVDQLTSAKGIFSLAFAKLGIIEEGSSLINDERFFRGIITVSDIWQGVGFNSVIYIAALGAIDDSLYEAAGIDGAGSFKKLWHVSLPSILPTVMMMLILKVGTMLNFSFEKIVLLSSNATYNVSETVSTYIYRVGANGGNYSYTTAIGLFNSVLGFLLLLASNRVSRKLTESSVF